MRVGAGSQLPNLLGFWGQLTWGAGGTEMQPRTALVWPAWALQPGGGLVPTFGRTALAMSLTHLDPHCLPTHPLPRPGSFREPRVTPVTGRPRVGLKVSVQPIRSIVLKAPGCQRKGWSWVFPEVHPACLLASRLLGMIIPKVSTGKGRLGKGQSGQSRGSLGAGLTPHPVLLPLHLAPPGHSS